MKTTGIVLVTIGILGGLGCLVGGHSFFGPAFFGAIGAYLIHCANKKDKS